MVQLLDISTLRICSMLASTSFGLVFLVFWYRQRGSAHLLHWAASSFLYALTILAFAVLPDIPLSISICLFAAMGASDVLVVSGIRSLDGRRPFAAWMIAPPLLLANAIAIPSLLATHLGIGGPASIDVSEILGLIGSMGISGIAVLIDRGKGPLSRARTTAGIALLAYLPGYVGTLIVRLGFIHSHDILSIVPMLADQLLLGVLNLSLLAMPVERAHAQLRDMALRDHLTGVWNRAGLAMHFSRLGAHGAAIVAIDVDHFKSLNDQYGHGAGDDILVALAHRLDALAIEMGGAVARIGGDEFVAILPRITIGEAKIFAARLRAQPDEGRTLPRWTVSIGLAAIAPGTADIGAALKRADLSLYRAKALGRDRVAA